MKRQITYCDTCGKSMSYIDSEGDTQIEGVTFKVDDRPVTITAMQQTRSGSNSIAAILHSGDFCSVHCMCLRFKTELKRVGVSIEPIVKEIQS